ncbi:diphthine--ammonia ligase [Halobacillus sp. A1]|uniref:Dph6-related ATP pyrophosphatase n=1 Tax=Halobacillus sp. A1 TaxID=2880262 RepID=UPI0020A668D3|nr:diphthine--ammonia ligase [Halobacillus sp. A1]MCP3032064.1 diphthine--ammonia ligase [Halobacillus sp. A1]
MQGVIVSWSGGKDSALALYKLLNSEGYRVEGLLSTTSSESERLPVHEVRRELIKKQAESLNLPLFEVQLPANADNETYEHTLSQQFAEFKKQDIEMIAFADLFLQEIREYRENLLERCGMKGVFPLWGMDTSDAAADIIELGIKTVITTVDTEKLSPQMLGRSYSAGFLKELPDDIDPCGENGEFHTFVYDGPLFNEQIKVMAESVFETMNGRFAHIELRYRS